MKACPLPTRCSAGPDFLGGAGSLPSQDAQRATSLHRALRKELREILCCYCCFSCVGLGGRWPPLELPVDYGESVVSWDGERSGAYCLESPSSHLFSPIFQRGEREGSKRSGFLKVSPQFEDKTSFCLLLFLSLLLYPFPSLHFYSYYLLSVPCPRSHEGPCCVVITRPREWPTWVQIPELPSAGPLI